MTSHSFDSEILTILVVDDEEPVREVLEAILTLSGHQITLASDGFAALEMFPTKTWDVVLTDRNMPGMNGEELAKHLKALSPRTPVIMVTGFAPPTGCPYVDAIVHKPFTLASLAEAIGRCVAAGQSADKRVGAEMPAVA